MSARYPLLLLLAGIEAGVHGQDYSLFGPCSQEKRFTESDACFEYMRTAAGDPGIFWFGASLQMACADNEDERNLTCQNALPEGADPFTFQTLGSRAFNDATFDSETVLSELSSPMSVVYSSPQEYAYGCNTTQGGGQFVFDSHPNLAPLPSFFFRYAPAISVPECTTEQLCTLPLLEGYIAPGANRMQPDPYVWYAMKQPEGADLEMDDFPSPGPGYSFDFPTFKSQYNLTGPIAMSWLLATQDPYTNRYLLKYGMGSENQLATCPLLLEAQLLRESNRISNDIGVCPEPNTLEMWVPVKFPAPLTSSQPVPNGGAGLWADSISNGFIAAEWTKEKPAIYPVYRLKDPTIEDFQDKIYSLLIIQNEVGCQRADLCGPNATVLVHYMEINIRMSDAEAKEDGQLGNEGLVVLDYAGCDKIGPGAGGGQFYLLIFEQAGEDDLGPPNDYVTVECPAPGTGLRCQFPLKRWVDENALKLVGMSRWRIRGGRYKAKAARKKKTRLTPLKLLRSQLQLEQKVPRRN